MKTVFNNRQLAHVWANQSQDSGRNSTGSMFFECSTIYSYGRHYAIATIYSRNESEKDLILVNEYNYSNTTAKQRNDVLRALTPNQLYIFVPDVTELKSEKNETYLFNQVIKELEQGMSSRTSRFYFDSLETSIKNLNLYFEYLGKKPFQLDELYYDTLKEINKIRIDRNLERDALNKMKIERLAAECENARLARIVEFKTELELWPQGLNTKSIPRDLFPRDYDLVRIKPNQPDTLETSNGAEVPLSHALRLLKLVLAKDISVGERVGHFKVDAVKDTTLTIGCHTINIEQAKSVLMPLLQRSEIKAV